MCVCSQFISVSGCIKIIKSSQLSTVNSQQSTLNSQLSTVNSQQSTLNSQQFPRSATGIGIREFDRT
ncbi:hypothetical protein [Tychonema sp. LEGE 07203]|uniref:hypothetical protein n=1 Tax=Tychonema sp. LEGE 07203 TaxID=1828671 RepID=UPI0019FA3F27|nr:hypothetical protein [Tychonema sp. LEGE 07203]MBE9097718.1 hypothetical protein [Tychonema sp. LEGE 07203]